MLCHAMLFKREEQVKNTRDYVGFAPSVRDTELPTLPTRPLVFRTPFLVSALRRDGLARTLLTLMAPWPAPLFSREGVLGCEPAGAVFSASLSPYDVVHVEVMVVLVVVMLTARRSRSFASGDRDAVRRAIWRRWKSSSDSPSN